MEKGGSFETFAADVETGRATLYRWLDEHAEFRDAKQVGEALAHKFFEDMGIHSLTDGAGFNNNVWNVMMKNRFGYRDKIEHKVEQTNITIDVNKLLGDLKEVLEIVASDKIESPKIIDVGQKRLRANKKP